MRRGLIKHEIAIKELLKNENLDVLFLVETDTKTLKSSSEYIFKGYDTILQKTNEKNPKVRTIALINNTISSEMVIMNDDNVLQINQ